MARKNSSRRVCIHCFLSTILVVAIVSIAVSPFLTPYSFKFIIKMSLSAVTSDKKRFLDNELQLAYSEWKLYQMETRYGQLWCKEKFQSRNDVTWLTIVTNDDFIVPALVLGHSIRTFSCQRNMIAYISEDVSKNTREALQASGWETRLVGEMDCNWMDEKLGRDRNSSFFGIPLGKRIKGTHTRFHAWNYTQFSKIVYVDADYMLMTNMDELFDIEEDFAVAPSSRPGLLDPCFNAGLLVFRPDSRYYREIMEFWRKKAEKGTCLNDQEVLNEYYSDLDNWKTLPYAYNVRRSIFRPLKSFHFACCRPRKPWAAECRPSRREASEYNGPILTVDDIAVLFWKNFYQLLRTYSLEVWYRSTKFYRPEQEFGNVSYADCVKEKYTSEPFSLRKLLIKN